MSARNERLLMAGTSSTAHRAPPSRGSPSAGGGPFPPIADYAFLSDSEVMALVAPSGDVEWLCLPRPDSPSVFGALLDRDAGSFRVGPTNVAVPAARRYLPGTMVLETTWMTRAGGSSCATHSSSALASRGRTLAVTAAGADRPRRGARARADREVRARLRRAAGRVRACVRLRPIAGGVGVRGAGYGLAVATAEGAGVELRLATDLRLASRAGGRARG